LLLEIFDHPLFCDNLDGPVLFIPLILVADSLSLRAMSIALRADRGMPDQMKYPCSGIILAGGENKRFFGENKALLALDGKRIIDRIYSVFTSLFDDIVLVTNTPESYLEFDATVVSDIFPVRSSMTGIHAGLFYAAHPHAFVAACDMPFLQSGLVSYLASQIRENIDVVIPETEKGLEPLCAVYARDCIGLLERKILEHKFKIQQIFNKNRVRKIPEPALRKHDPDLVSFFNVNSSGDLETAKQKLHTFTGQEERGMRHGSCETDSTNQTAPAVP
jgi:molybdenum cofactor guanylyltransferase